MIPDDLDLLRIVSVPSLTPDGRTVVFAVTRPDVGADAYVGQLWRAPVDGSAPGERLTRGFRDTAPQVSPDGSLVAFLRAPADGRSQLHVVRTSGGEPVRLTDAQLGVGELAWSSDSTRLVFVARLPEPGRYGTVDGLSAPAEPARRLTTTRYLANGVGYITDRRAQLFTVVVPDVGAEPVLPRAPSAADPTPEQPSGLPEAVQLTFDDTDHGHPCGTDQGAVTFVATSHDGHSEVLRSAAYRLELEADGRPGGVTEIAGPDDGLFVDAAREVAGRTWLIARAIDPAGADFVGVQAALYVVEPGQPPRRLTDPETLDVQDSAIVPDGDRVLVQEVTRGTVQLLRAHADGRTERLTDGPVEVLGVAAAGGQVVVSVADPRSTGDVAVVDGEALRPLTDLSAPLRSAGTVEPQELVVPTRDGGQVHGWVVEPATPGPHPTLLLIHGGPFAQFTGSLFDEAQVYAGAGYAVVMGNPRGSAGYGQAFGQSIRHRMGTVDMTDVLDLLDGALDALPALDRSRLGIMGGSYGGYLTAWTIAHDLASPARSWNVGSWTRSCSSAPPTSAPTSARSTPARIRSCVARRARRPWWTGSARRPC